MILHFVEVVQWNALRPARPSGGALRQPAGGYGLDNGEQNQPGDIGNTCRFSGITRRRRGRALTWVCTTEAGPVYERRRRTDGLPVLIRIDNGVPFATSARARSSPHSDIRPTPSCAAWAVIGWQPLARALGQGEARPQRRIHRLRGDRDALWQVPSDPIALGRFQEALLRLEDQHGDLARMRRRTTSHLQTEFATPSDYFVIDVVDRSE